MHLRTLALLAAFTVVSAIQTEAFLLDFSGVTDGPMAAFSPVPGQTELATARSTRNEVAAGFGDLTGGGRGIELQSLFSVGSENNGASDSEFILTTLNSEILNSGNNWVGFRTKVDITTGAVNAGFIRENADNGGDDFGGIQFASDGTFRAFSKSPVPGPGVLPLGNYNADQWYNFALDIDFAGGSTDVYLDGANMGSVDHDAVHADAVSIAFFAFRGLDSDPQSQNYCNCSKDRGAPQLRIDYIATGSSLAEVTIPEPASLGLLAMSSMLVLSRRSRRA